jgi:hypothetical protein
MVAPLGRCGDLVGRRRGTVRHVPANSERIKRARSQMQKWPLAKSRTAKVGRARTGIRVFTRCGRSLRASRLRARGSARVAGRNVEAASWRPGWRSAFIAKCSSKAHPLCRRDSAITKRGEYDSVIKDRRDRAGSSSEFLYNQCSGKRGRGA